MNAKQIYLFNNDDLLLDFPRKLGKKEQSSFMFYKAILLKI